MENRPVPSYFNRPVLKAPVWTWEVPVYFFAGGAAGAAAAIALAAAAAGEADVARHARWVAAAGALISPLLLISDLGRPARFLYMLRVFKLQSPMSVGAWTLVVFSAAAFAGVTLTALHDANPGPGLETARFAADVPAAVTGLILATYTGVLLGATAIPVWAAHARALPVLFGASAFGAAVSILELMGHLIAPLNTIGAFAAATEVAVALHLHRRRGAAARALSDRRAAVLLGAGDLAAGIVPLVLRLTAASSPPARVLAAALTIAGSLATRFGWIAAGRASAADPAAALAEGTQP